MEACCIYRFFLYTHRRDSLPVTNFPDYVTCISKSPTRPPSLKMKAWLVTLSGSVDAVYKTTHLKKKNEYLNPKIENQITE